MLEPRDIYWAAGIMEGEGYFGSRKDGGINVVLCMTDKDVIDRFFSLFPFASRRERLLPSGKTAYSWVVGSQRHAAGFMMMLLPLMGSRRSAKIIELITKWKSRPLPKKLVTQCKNGHELSGDNLRIIEEGKYMKRRCVTCGRDRQRKYRSLLPDLGVAA